MSTFIHVPVSMARQTYNYNNYFPTAITPVVEGNCLTLIATALSAPSPAQKVLISTPWSFHKTVFVATVLSAARPSRKAATAATASLASRPTHKVVTSTPQSAHKIASVAAAASSAPRPFHKAATLISQSAHKTASAAFALLSAFGRIKRRSRKAGPASRRTHASTIRTLSLCRPGIYPQDGATRHADIALTVG
ncbi:hypothetical protein ACLOJK_037354 [Asimina triloba]